MNILDAIKERRSVRFYKETPVTEEQVREIVDIARNCPSWSNTQTTRYHVVLDEAKRKELVGINDYNARYLESSQATIIVTMVKGKAGSKGGDPSAADFYHTSKEWTMLDAGIAVDSFCLTAHALGFGTLIMGLFDADKIRSIVPIPENEDIVCVLSMGEDLGKGKKPPRIDLDDVITVI